MANRAWLSDVFGLSYLKGPASWYLNMKLAHVPLLVLLVALTVMPMRPVAEERTSVLDAVVGIRSEVPVEARTASSLGRVREGTGVLIDGSGLVLTIGYLILEASAVDIIAPNGSRIPATIVAYDHESGFGLVRGHSKIRGIKPIPLGNSAAIELGTPLLAVSRVGGLDGVQVSFTDRRDFAGYWEYLLPQAVFTTPVHRQFGGAALIDTSGSLVGIGSLFVRDAEGQGIPSPGNMFIPAELLPPILGDLLVYGRRSGPAKPWIGVYGHNHPKGIALRRVAEDGPSYRAGIRPGDIIVAIDGAPVRDLMELYRTMWDLGDAGVDIPVKVRRRDRDHEFTVASTDRYDWLRFEQSY